MEVAILAIKVKALKPTHSKLLHIAEEQAVRIHPTSLAARVHPTSLAAQVHPTSLAAQVHLTSLAAQVHPTSLAAQVHLTSLAAQVHPTNMAAQVHPTSLEVQVHFISLQVRELEHLQEGETTTEPILIHDLVEPQVGRGSMLIHQGGLFLPEDPLVRVDQGSQAAMESVIKMADIMTRLVMKWINMAGTLVAAAA